MKFGHFDDVNREYVINTPLTPYPWINYLGNEKFFSLISNTSGGYAFFTDARLRRLTRYRYNDIPLDTNGRYLYIKDGDTIWNPGYKPMKTKLDSYECRHGFGYTKISSSKNNLSADVLYMVPNGENCEVEMITVKNNSNDIKSISITSFVEWCLYNASDDCQNFQRNFSTGEVEIEGSAIYHKTEYRERRNHFTFYSVNEPIAGFDTDRESFMGLHNDLSTADTILAGKSKNSVADGWSPIASHRLECTLKPGDSKTYIFVLGYIENDNDKKFIPTEKAPKDLLRTNTASGIINKEKAYELQKKFDTPAKVQAAFDTLKAFWDETLSHFVIKTGDEKLDRMSVWNQYQCVVTYNFARSASYFESGIGRGLGFRDTSQDMLGAAHQMPKSRIRERLYDVAATQFEDGSAYHQFQPLTKRGNADIGSNFNDDPLWLVLGVGNYIRETGDTDFLKVDVPFDNSETNKATMFEHLKRSYNYIPNHMGPHGLPLIGRADWNDCLNLNCFSWDPNESFQTTENKTEGSKAESLMIAGLFVLCGRDYVALCEHIGKKEEAERCKAHINNMIAAVKKDGWDGEWYLRAYDFYGNKIGSKENEEGKIFIESQGFCTMAGIGLEDGMVDKALDSCKKYLDCEHGMVLNHPAYTTYHVEMGEISSYPAGYKENAGIFCHNNPWVIIGETVAGRGNDAWEHYTKICPAWIKDQTLHKVEPYVYSQMVAGKDAAKPGEGKNSWLTGTAAWNWYAITQFILGIKPTFDGIEIDPCIPSDMKEYSVKRILRGAEFDIHVSNPNGAQKGVKSITVDGKEIQGNIIRFTTGKHKVEVRM